MKLTQAWQPHSEKPSTQTREATGFSLHERWLRPHQEHTSSLKSKINPGSCRVRAEMWDHCWLLLGATFPPKPLWACPLRTPKPLWACPLHTPKPLWACPLHTPKPLILLWPHWTGSSNPRSANLTVGGVCRPGGSRVVVLLEGWIQEQRAGSCEGAGGGSDQGQGQCLLLWIRSSSRVERKTPSTCTPSSPTPAAARTPVFLSTQRHTPPRHPPRNTTACAENSSSLRAPAPHCEFHTVPFSRGSTQHEGGTPHACTPGPEQLKYLQGNEGNPLNKDTKPLCAPTQPLRHSSASPRPGTTSSSIGSAPISPILSCANDSFSSSPHSPSPSAASPSAQNSSVLPISSAFSSTSHGSNSSPGHTFPSCTSSPSGEPDKAASVSSVSWREREMQKGPDRKTWINGAQGLGTAEANTACRGAQGWGTAEANTACRGAQGLGTAEET
ncbi:hypothetical protein JZ751_019173 [Albula glossodonta]|uniref:Uncharacterized protein n=1 Tax=Albula glossodonta TaxID=121402 RepID=A0A8T2MTL1_9TELE|nr:hypothetical protein JZ751_019173 [Albula glossodonta]